MAGGGAVMRCEGRKVIYAVFALTASEALISGLLLLAGNAVADTEAHTKSAPEEEWRTFGGRDDEREIGGD